MGKGATKGKSGGKPKQKKKVAREEELAGNVGRWSSSTMATCGRLSSISVTEKVRPLPFSKKSWSGKECKRSADARERCELHCVRRLDAERLQRRIDWLEPNPPPVPAGRALQAAKCKRKARPASGSTDPAPQAVSSSSDSEGEYSSAPGDSPEAAAASEAPTTRAEHSAKISRLRSELSACIATHVAQRTQQASASEVKEESLSLSVTEEESEAETQGSLDEDHYEPSLVEEDQAGTPQAASASSSAAAAPPADSASTAALSRKRPASQAGIEQYREIEV